MDGLPLLSVGVEHRVWPAQSRALRAGLCLFPHPRLGPWDTATSPPTLGSHSHWLHCVQSKQQPQGLQSLEVPREGAEAPSSSDELLSCLTDSALFAECPVCPAALSCPELGDSVLRCHHERGVCHQRRLAP